MKRPLLVLALLGCLALCACTSPQARAYRDDDVIAQAEDVYNIHTWRSSVAEDTLDCAMNSAVGTLTVWRMDAADTASVRVACELTVRSGKAKLVHIAPDGTVATLLEVSPDAPVNASVLTFPALPGENRVKLVMAEGTSLDMTLHFDAGQLCDAV